MREVALAVGGRRYVDWLHIRIERRLDTLSGSFALTSPDIDGVGGLVCGEPVVIMVGSETLITGHIEAVRKSFDTSGANVELHGRDKTGDLVDSSVDIKADGFRNQTLHQIAQRLCQRFNIRVIDMVNDKKRFELLKIMPGETAFAALDHAARRRGVLLSGDSAGNVIISKIGSGGNVGSLIEGTNILSLSQTADQSQRHSEYILRAQSDEDFSLEVRSIDPGIKRYRPLITVDQSNITKPDAQKMVEWERAMRRGRSMRVSVVVQGWESPARKLWDVNQMVKVIAPRVHLDAEFLIVGVDFSFDENGTTATLDLAPCDSFSPKPEIERGDQW